MFKVNNSDTYYDMLSCADKLKHFWGSIALCAWLAVFNPLGVAMLIAFGIGVLKELYDALAPRGTGFSFPDLIADAAGVFIAAAIVNALRHQLM
jgi:VanZ family protein